MTADIADRTTELVIGNLALAQSIARRFGRHDAGRDEDLVQVAYLGLIKAARRYREGRGAGFAAYAAPTIEGELKRYLRDHGWSVRPPRAEQDLNRRILRAMPGLAQELQRTPSHADVARALDESPEAVSAAVACDGSLRAVSLDAPVHTDASTTLADALPDERAGISVCEQRVMLWAALRTLPARERMIVYLRFFEDLSQQSIAERMGVSQMHVSRLLRRTLERLRLAIGA